MFGVCMYIHTYEWCSFVSGHVTALIHIRTYVHPAQVKPEALGSQDGRSTLFSALLSVATSADQLTTLAQLLKLWPTSRWEMMSHDLIGGYFSKYPPIFYCAVLHTCIDLFFYCVSVCMYIPPQTLHVLWIQHCCYE